MGIFQKKGIDVRAAYALLFLMDWMRRCLCVHPAHVFGRKRQEREMPRALDGDCQFALVPGAGADFAAGANLAAVGQVAAQLVAVLVVNDFVFIFAVNTDPALRRRKTALSVASVLVAAAAAMVGTRTAWSARPAARTGTAAWLIIHTLR